MNKHQKVSGFNCGKMSIHNFSSSSPPTLIFSSVLFVCWAKCQIRLYDWSDCLSVKLPVKGQLAKGFSCQVDAFFCCRCQKLPIPTSNTNTIVTIDIPVREDWAYQNSLLLYYYTILWKSMGTILQNMFFCVQQLRVSK